MAGMARLQYSTCSEMRIVVDPFSIQSFIDILLLITEREHLSAELSSWHQHYRNL